MATLKLSTKRAALSINVTATSVPAALPANVFSIGQARVNREAPTYLTGRI